MTKQLLYVADPMCSWCWGFSPVISQVQRTYGDKVPMQIMMGGLRPGTIHAMTDNDKTMVKDHWGHVTEASGQPFDFSFFDLDGFVYDTEPACRSIVTARKLDESKTLGFLEAVHGAFYRDKKDTTNTDQLCDIAGDAGFNKELFKQFFTSDEIMEETQGDFWFSQKSGITGFPTLVAVEDGKGSIVTAGYRPWEQISETLDQWLENFE